MSLKQRLDQRQVQKLILAPALQQAIKLLPLTNLELIEVIDEELSQNPMIEIEDEAREAKPKDSETVAAEEAGVRAREGVLDGLNLESMESKIRADGRGTDVLAGFQEYLDEGFRPHFSDNREAISLENTLSRTPSLWDHLEWQASLTFFDPEERERQAEKIRKITAVTGAFKRIGDKCQTVIRCYCVDDCSLAETAEKAGYSEKTIWKRVQECLKRMRQCLA